MREGVGSRTAERVAARRAAHQLLDAPLVFSDPLALRILAPEVAEQIRQDPKSLDRSPITSLDDALGSSSFDRTSPAVFSWLGVVPYLELPAIEATLASVARMPAGTTIVFDYGVSTDALNFAERFVVRRMAKRVAAAGEPWKTFFVPEEMAALLRRTGFRSHLDWGSEEINARYFAGRTDGLRVGRGGRIVKATVS